MTDQSIPAVCPNCQHPHHIPGAECATPVHHGPNRWHLCLCLARPGAALSCPPQMTCQGGTLGYADIWYLQHGHVLVGEDGTIAPGAVQTGVASVGFPSGPDIASAAASAAVVPAADRAAVLREAVRRIEDGELLPDRDLRFRRGADWVLDALRRLAAEAAVPAVGVAADTTPAETQECAHCGKPVRQVTGTLTAWWVHDPDGHTACHPQQADSPRAEPGPVVPAQPGNDTETPVGYSGKGRLWCLACPRPESEDLPVTTAVVRDGELCAGCGRDVVDMARATEQQPKEA